MLFIYISGMKMKFEELFKVEDSLVYGKAIEVLHNILLDEGNIPKGRYTYMLHYKGHPIIKFKGCEFDIKEVNGVCKQIEAIYLYGEKIS